MDNIIEINGKKYIRMGQNMFGYKEHLDKDHNIVREPYAEPLKVVPYEEIYIIEGELYTELTDDISEGDNLV